MPPSPSNKKMTLRERYESIRKAIKANSGKTKKKNSNYTYTGNDANGLDGSYYLSH